MARYCPNNLRLNLCNFVCPEYSHEEYDDDGSDKIHEVMNHASHELWHAPHAHIDIEL